MRNATLQALRQRYVFRCGYCGISEMDNGASLTVDHFQPRTHGGSDAPDNLVYCCHACNEHKGDWWNPDGVERVLHPLHDDISVHILLQEDGLLHPLTETGTFHIRRLYLNRLPLVNYRRSERLDEQESRERQEVLALLRTISAQLSAVEDAVRDKQRGGE
jgi:hypothetical protein